MQIDSVEIEVYTLNDKLRIISEVRLGPLFIHSTKASIRPILADGKYIYQYKVVAPNSTRKFIETQIEPAIIGQRMIVVHLVIEGGVNQKLEKLLRQHDIYLEDTDGYQLTFPVGGGQSEQVAIEYIREILTHNGYPPAPRHILSI